MWSTKLPNTYALAHIAALLLERGQAKNTNTAVELAFEMWVKSYNLINRETRKSRPRRKPNAKRPKAAKKAGVTARKKR